MRSIVLSREFKPLAGLCQIGAVLICIWLMPTLSTAQKEELEIGPAYNKSVQAIGAQNYKQALKLCNAIIKSYGNTNAGKKLFGPAYGHWFYLRGLAFMGLKNWDAAGKDFEICYKCTDQTEKIRNCKKCVGFGRITGTLAKDRDPDGKMACPDCGGIPYRENSSPNLFRMHALVQWGNCEMIKERYAKAAELYQKSLKEDYAKRLSARFRLFAAVNLGRCLIKSDKVDEGYNFIVRALDSPGFSNQLRQTVFQILAEDWSPLVPPEKLYPFLNKYSYVTLSDNYENRVRRNSTFFKLAHAALKKKDPVLSLRWNRLLAHPGPQITKNLATGIAYSERKKTEQDSGVIKKLDQEIQRLGKDNETLKNNLWLMMSDNGNAYFMVKNFAASYGVFRRLSDQAPEHKDRPVFLHNAVVSAVQIDDWKGAYRYGMKFLKEFPKHELKPAVVRVLVEIIFINGNYQEAYDIATDVRDEMEVGSEIRDIPDYIVGASAFQLGRPGEADRELTAYLKNYPNAQRKEPALYFLGSAKVKLYHWQEGTDIFDPFLSDYPSSAMTSSVLYQNGLCKFMIDDNEAANALVKRLLSEFPTASEIPVGWNLLGDISAVEERSFPEVIRPAYRKAQETSANFPDQLEVAAYALWQLMMNAADNELWEEAEMYFDEFRKKHHDSAYGVDMMIGALPTLVERGRLEEAVQGQVDLLYTTGKDPESGGISELFGTFFKFIEEHDPENRMAHLEELTVNSKSSEALRNWAVIGMIDILEEPEDEDNEDKINVLYHRMNSKFNPARNSNYVIVRLARWHTNVRNKPDDAKPLYDFVLEQRPGTDDYDFALLDRAGIDAQSSLPEDRQRAMEYYDRVINEYGKAELAEEASVGIARMLTEDRKYEQAHPRWEAYMDNSSWSKYAAEANYSYGLCLDKAGNTKDAFVVYINTYNAFPGHVDYSTPSYLRAALIMKERGDDLQALLILQDMLTRLEKIEHPNMEKGYDMFERWKAEYVPAKDGGSDE